MNRQRAFTIIELLTVIAIIAVLAAILFPVFAAAREQARQSSTMSNMQAIYQGAGLYFADEGRYPSVLFGYAEVPVPNTDPQQYRPALPSDAPSSIIPMDESHQKFNTYLGGSNVNQGYLYREQIKDLNAFTSPANQIKDKTAVTQVYYPRVLWPIIDPAAPTTLNANKLVVWQKSDASVTPRVYGDTDLPDLNYAGQPKLYYVMDSMDIGPMLDDYGGAVKDGAGNQLFELHYAPDWTHHLGAADDVAVNPFTSQLGPIVTQLKYKNPPSERTVITYVTHHAANNGSSKVMVISLSGTARKIDVKDAYQQLPIWYQK